MGWGGHNMAILALYNLCTAPNALRKKLLTMCVNS